MNLETDKEILAYITGVAIGDGNLSNPNGRATRLRVTCDVRYPLLIKKITAAIKTILPDNKVSLVNRPRNCVDISCYSNKWEGWLGWEANGGSKYNQNVSIPDWIKENREFLIQCLKGLFETDGSIYKDRKYIMTSFVNTIPRLANDVSEAVRKLGFEPHLYKVEKNRPDSRPKYTVRISKNAGQFIKLIGLEKK